MTLTADRLKGPSSTYPLGTDHIGRDLFSRLLYGARVSLGVGFAATTLSVVVSLLIGGAAGFVGGQGIPQIIGMLGLASGVANSRVVRGAVIGIKGNPYCEAAHAIGSPSWRTLLRHVWPNITAPVIIIYSITIGWAIIAEASARAPPSAPRRRCRSWNGRAEQPGVNDTAHHLG